jgi:hypothetical protein
MLKDLIFINQRIYLGFIFFLSFFSQSYYSISDPISSITSEQKIVLLDSNLSDIHELEIKVNSKDVFILDKVGKKVGNDYFYNIYFALTNKKLKIILPDSVWNEYDYFNDFFVNSNKLYLLAKQSIFYLEIADTLFKYKKNIKLPIKCQYLTNWNEKIITYNACVFAKQKVPDHINLIEIDSTDKITTTSFPSPHGMKWTIIQPRKLIDIYESKVAISDADRYRIIIYNRDGIPIDSIIRLPKNWIEQQDTSTNHLSSLSSLMDSMFVGTFIQNVHLINNEKVVVSWTAPEKEGNGLYQIYLDIWNKKNGEWVLTFNDIQKTSRAKDEQFNIENLRYEKFYFSQDYLIYLVPLPYVLNDEHYKKTNKEMIYDINEYYYNNGLRYSLILNKIK